MTFEYDRDADILYMNKCAPYADQESEELSDGMIARLNPKTRDIETIEVLFFSTHLSSSSMFDIPVSVAWQPSIQG